MPKKRELDLSPEERAELEEVRRKHKKPHVRERAAAILKVADGMSILEVARSGLYQKRAPDSVRLWLNRYEAEGISGLENRPGRGRKPAFSPSVSRRRGRLRRTAGATATRPGSVRV